MIACKPEITLMGFEHTGLDQLAFQYPQVLLEGFGLILACGGACEDDEAFI
jgi:hypothetical protein